MMLDGTPWPRMMVGNVVVDLVSRDHALSLILDAKSEANPLAVVSGNLHHINLFAENHEWRDRRPATPAQRPESPAVQVRGPTCELRWLTLLDGVPLVRTANAISGHKWPKLSGSDLIYPILEAGAERGLRVGFLGGTQETLRRLRAISAERFPALQLAGTWAPERWELTDAAASLRIASEIRQSRADILVVGLGKPRQEEWIERFGAATGASVLLAFGSVVDLLAGRVQRAPQFVADAGVEWAWRLAHEPRRLGHRYLIACPPALLRLVRSAKIVEPVPPEQICRGPAGFVGPLAHAAVTALVVTRNNAADIGLLIDDLRCACGELPIRVVVVDNESTDGTVDIVRSHEDVIVVESGGNLGYAGGVNAGLRFTGDCDDVLILNADVSLAPGAVTQLHRVARTPGVGAVVPLILDADGVIFPSLYREPSITRAIGDAFLGGKLRKRMAFTSEFDLRPESYRISHDIDWATGAVVLIPSDVIREVGEWNEEFFLYSEEVDYFRRIRSVGLHVRFEPIAVSQHRGGGSGTSSALVTLKTVNRIRYVERHRSRPYAALYRAVVVLAALIRGADPVQRGVLTNVINRRHWPELPHATQSPAPGEITGPTARGAVIIPACNEVTVIERILTPLSCAAVEGFIEVIVVCNGCDDDTAGVARSVPGIRVVELRHASKPDALNAGDEAATLWPRLYLDADVEMPVTSVLELLDRLATGGPLVARPGFWYDTRASSPLVRCYYRARTRIHQGGSQMWGAGAYALSREGHARFGEFPAVTADDLYVDTRFDPVEKAVVRSASSVIRTPTDARTLLSVLRRHHRGDAELLAMERGAASRVRSSGRDTAIAAVATIRGPVAAFDAGVYLTMAFLARNGYRLTRGWERDNSSREVAAQADDCLAPTK
jgi:exopolysaccharide biosynthesis WecB/TagA/CpsF family protein